MPGWTTTTNLNPKQTLGVNTIIRPAIPSGQAAWWTDFVSATGKEFVRQAGLMGNRPSTVSISANNGAGDANGLGTLTIVITAS